MGEGLAFLGILFVLFATLFGAHVTTRWYSERILGSKRLGNAHKLALVYRVPLGREQNIAVVRVGTRHILIGCTSQSISFLTELTEDECQFLVGDESGDSSKVPNFTQILQRAKDEGKDNDVKN